MNFKKIRDKYEPTEHENHSGEWYETYTVNQIQKETASAVIEKIEKVISKCEFMSSGYTAPILHRDSLLFELDKIKKELQ